MSDRIPNFPPVIASVAKGINRPLWSIMIPAYNCISFLKETVQSVLVQDLGEAVMQIEVVDDCSTDGDVAGLVQAVGKGRITYFRQEQNRGSLRNFETCLNRAKGQLIHLLHGDDLVYPGFYEEINSLFITFPEAGAAFTNFSVISTNNKILKNIKPLSNKSEILHNFLFQIAHGQLLQPPAIVVKRNVYETLGGFYGAHYGEDWEMWTRIAANFPIAYSPKCLAIYRFMRLGSITHNAHLSGQNARDLIKMFNLIQKHLPPEKRKKLANNGLKFYSIYLSQSANTIYCKHKDIAFKHAKEAWKTHRNIKTLYFISKLYLKKIIGFERWHN